MIGFPRLLLAISSLALATSAASCSQAQGPSAEGAVATTASAEPAPESPQPPSPPPPPLADPLSVGSKAAQDDLYCAGLLIAAFPTPMEALVPVEQARVERAQTNALIIGETGLQKLIQEGAAVSGQANQILDAWADAAGRDFAAGQPRIPVETCTQRAEAVTP